MGAQNMIGQGKCKKHILPKHIWCNQLLGETQIEVHNLSLPGLANMDGQVATELPSRVADMIH